MRVAMAGATDVEVETDGFYNELAATVREVLQTVRGDVECQTLRHVVKTELEAPGRSEWSCAHPCFCKGFAEHAASCEHHVLQLSCRRPWDYG